MVGEYKFDKKTNGNVFYGLNLVAVQCFMMQHALFVGQYVRVALAFPLTFCLQSDEVVRKRERRL